MPKFLLSAAASLVDQLDKKVMILLRDGRHIVGMMRSFDQFANLVLEDTFERRIIVSASGRASYGDLPLGLYIVRGDAIILLGNIVLSTFQTTWSRLLALGEVSQELEASDSYPEQVSMEEIINMQQTGPTPQAKLEVGD